MLNWIKNYKKSRQYKTFHRLILGGDLEKAMKYYEVTWGTHPIIVDKAIRSIYYFYQVILFNDSKARKQITQLTYNTPLNSQARRLVEVIRQIDQVKQLTISIQQNKYPEKRKEKAISPLEDIGVILIEVLRKNQVSSRQNLKVISQNKKKYESLIQLVNDYPDFLSDGIQTKLKLHLVLLIMKWAMANNQPMAAIKAFQQLENQFTSKSRQEFILKIGIQAILIKKYELASQWFLHELSVNASNPEGKYLYSLGQAVALLGGGKFFQGNKELQKLIRSENNMEKRVNLAFLLIMSNLAETQDWPNPSSQSNSHTVRIQNFTLWQEKKPDLLSKIQLIQQHSQESWQGYLLEGLFAYIENSSILNSDQLTKFTEAIDSVSGTKIKHKLNQIKGNLLRRIRATSEAYTIIKERDYEKLLEFNENVLEPLGQAIPTLLRASVLMTISEYDSTFNPLPELKKLTPSTEEKKQVDECIQQIQVIQTIKRLKLIINAKEGTTDHIPPIQMFEFDENIYRWIKMTVALIHIRAKEWDLAFRISMEVWQDPGIDYRLEQAVAYLVFFSAWRLKKYDICKNVLTHVTISFFSNQEKVLGSLNSRIMVENLSNQENISELHIWLENEQKKHKAILPNLVLNFIASLIKLGKLNPALRIIQKVQESLENEKKSSDPGAQITLNFLYGVVNTQLGKFSLAIETFLEIIHTKPISDQKYPNKIREKDIYGWAKLFLVQSQIITFCLSVEENIHLKWPNVKRSLLELTQTFTESAILTHYGILVSGSIKAISSNTLVEEELIKEMTKALDYLKLSSKTGFVQSLLANLIAQKNIIDEFWQIFKEGKFRQLLTVYQEQILKLFGSQVPNQMKLAILIAKFFLRINLKALLVELNQLEREAPELNKELLEKLRRNILEDDKIIKVIRLFREQNYSSVIEFIAKTHWENYTPGTMPVHIAIALLFSNYIKRNSDAVNQMGKSIRGQENFALWVRNTNRLILGFELYQEKNYAEASVVFSEITQRTWMGHDVGKYEAVNQFSNGILLLEVGKNDDASVAFLNSVHRQKSENIDSSLSALLLHLANKSLDIRDGDKALEVFRILKEKLANSAGTKALYHQISILGELLCQSLLNQKNQSSVKPNDFLKGIEKLSKEDIHENAKAMFEQSSRKLALCQALRSPHTQKQSAIVSFVLQQLENLENLEKRLNQHDPLIPLIQSLIQLKYGNKSVHGEALNKLKKVKSLGLDTPNLNKVLLTYYEQIEQQTKYDEGIVELFDLFLTYSGNNSKILNAIVNDHHLSAFYQLHRLYIPKELSQTSSQKNSFEIIQERFEYLYELLNSDTIKGNSKVKGFIGRVEIFQKELIKLRAASQTIEEEILEYFSKQIRNDKSITSELLEQIALEDNVGPVLLGSV